MASTRRLAAILAADIVGYSRLMGLIWPRMDPYEVLLRSLELGERAADLDRK